MKWLSLFLFMALGVSSVSFGAEDSTYSFNWLDPDKEVYVLQNRKYRKNKKLYVNLGYGLTTSGAFADASAIQGRVGFFFKEEFGFEFLYSKNAPDTNETFESLVSINATPFVLFIEGYYGAMFMWAPFYSKINTFDRIIYFDWMFGLGGAVISEESNRTDFNAGQNLGRRDKKSRSGIMWQTAWRFYLTQHFSVRADLTAIHFQGEKAEQNTTAKVWYDNYDLSLSASWTF